MAATIIKPTDVIQIKRLTTVIFGPPGVGKTSFAQTAEAPITLDFDEGIHRAFNRQTSIRLTSWADIEAADAECKKPEYKTIVVDTAGRLLELMVQQLILESAKNGNKLGGLSISGYGVLATRFLLWSNSVKALGKDIIMIAHEKEEKDGDDRIFRPEMVGKSYSELCKQADQIGYLSIDRAGVRTINFKPSDRATGKDSAGLGQRVVGHLHEPENVNLMAKLLAEAKARITGYSKAQAEAVAKQQAAASPPAPVAPPVAPPPPVVPATVPPPPPPPAPPPPPPPPPVSTPVTEAPEQEDDVPAPAAPAAPPPAQKTDAEIADYMIEQWEIWVGDNKVGHNTITLEQFNAAYRTEYEGLAKLPTAHKSRVWKAIQAFAARLGYVWDKASVTFIVKG